MFKKIIILLIFPFIFAPRANAIDGFIKVTSPNSGTFTEGDTMHITWDSSANIDKVNIGYNTDPHHGGWVIFTLPNSHSYDWKVDVGNQTNTQFYLTITGYETGKGSVSSTSGTFTVIQNPPLFSSSAPTPTPSPTTSSTPTPSPNRWSGIVYPSPYPTPMPKPTTTPRLSYTNLVLWSEFWFEGSLTTDLKNISDPKNVQNFTLDTQKGFTFIFQESLNLTDQKTLSALEHTQDYWEYEAWFIWIEWEWWIKYDMEETVAVEYKNENLTAYPPTLDTTTPTTPPAKTKSTHKAPEILGAESGKVKLAVNDGTPIKIKPRVDMGTPASPVNSPKIELTGHTSHSNLSWTLNHNGQKSTPSPVINADTGEFIISVSDLKEGANTFVLSYQFENDDPISLEPITVIYDPSIWAKYGRIILTVLALILVFIAGIFAPRALPKLKKALKLKKKKQYVLPHVKR